jgi:hypothetical protein
MAVSNATAKNVEENVVTLDRRRDDRRAADDTQASTGTQPARRKKQRRRHIDPTTCERDYNNDEIEFMRAMDDYKRDSGRMFPTCSEVLEVIRALGYVKLTPDEAAHYQQTDLEEAVDFDAECEDQLLADQ